MIEPLDDQKKFFYPIREKGLSEPHCRSILGGEDCSRKKIGKSERRISLRGLVLPTPGKHWGVPLLRDEEGGKGAILITESGTEGAGYKRKHQAHK